MSRFALFLWLIPLASAQQYTISTVAGIGLLPFGGAGTPAVNAFLIEPYFVAADSAGNTYVSDQYYQQVFQIDTSGAIWVYAGNGLPGYSGDGGPASAAQLHSPAGLAVDSVGDLFIADSANGVVREVTPDGTISTVATPGAAEGVAVDAAGNLYVSQSGFNFIKKVDTSGVITTIAGTGAPGFSGDGGKATAAELYAPQGIKLDAAGNLYVADSSNNRIRKITPQGIISTVAGNGKTGLSGNGGPAASAAIWEPMDVAIDAQGNLYIADTNNERIRLVSPAGVIQPFAGGGASFGDGPAAQASLLLPYGLAMDNAGNVLVVGFKNRQVRRTSPQGAITTVAGLLPTTSAGDNIPAVSAPLFEPYGVIADGSGNVYVSDYADNRVREILASGTITTFAGDGLYDESPDNTQAMEMGNPRQMAFDAAGNLYISCGPGNFVRRVTPIGIVKTVAGGGPANALGNGGPATVADLLFPSGVAVDAAGNVYFAELNADRIRRVDTQGVITTIAGTRAPGYNGDGQPATSAQLYSPYQIAFDNNGNLYIADYGNNRIREITADGTITTVAGNSVRGGLGDGGAATAAQLSSPTGIAVDAAGNLYIATPAKVRMVNAATGVITTIAGTGAAGFSGDGGPATEAQLNGPLTLSLDGSGNIYFTDAGNYRVRMLTPGN